MKRFFSTINNPPIIVKESAWSKIIEISKTQKKINFLFSATSGGCNGFNYKFNILEPGDYEDIYNKHSNKIKPAIIKKDNIKILIDPMSELLLLGTTTDYIYEYYSKGIFENKFIFIPNKDLASSCGCGISFTPKN